MCEYDVLMKQDQQNCPTYEGVCIYLSLLLSMKSNLTQKCNNVSFVSLGLDQLKQTTATSLSPNSAFIIRWGFPLLGNASG